MILELIIFTALSFTILAVTYAIFILCINFIDNTADSLLKLVYKQYQVECTLTTEKGLYDALLPSYGINKNHAKARFYNMYGSRYKIVSVTRQ